MVFAAIYWTVRLGRAALDTGDGNFNQGKLIAQEEEA